MAIASYLDGFDADPETKRVLNVALEMTRTALGLADNFANGIIAKRIIELARAGERHPDLLCEGALKTLRGHLFGDYPGRSSKPPRFVAQQMGPPGSARDCIRPSFARPKGAS